MRSSAPAIRSRPRTMSRRRSSRTEFPSSPSRVRITRRTIGHIRVALSTIVRSIIVDDGADVVTLIHKERTDLAGRRHRRDRRDDHRRHSPSRDAERGRAASSRSSPSTTPRPSTSSTIATAPARARSTASFAPPTSCSPARRIVVAGYGWCGKGIAMRARGMGAQ